MALCSTGPVRRLKLTAGIEVVMILESDSICTYKLTMKCTLQLSLKNLRALWGPRPMVMTLCTGAHGGLFIIECALGIALGCR